MDLDQQEFKMDIHKEIRKTEVEIVMSGYNDGWWTRYMIEKLEKLKKLLNNNDNNNILDT
jgi:hypothetical protein